MLKVNLVIYDRALDYLARHLSQGETWDDLPPDLIQHLKMLDLFSSGSPFIRMQTFILELEKHLQKIAGPAASILGDFKPITDPDVYPIPLFRRADGNLLGFFWHGTSVENIDKIFQTSFLASKNGSSSGLLYGHGSYFAIEACKSVQYSANNDNCLALCAVFLGKRLYFKKGLGGALVQEATSIIAVPKYSRNTQQTHWEFTAPKEAQIIPLMFIRHLMRKEPEILIFKSIQPCITDLLKTDLESLCLDPDYYAEFFSNFLQTMEVPRQNCGNFDYQEHYNNPHRREKDYHYILQQARAFIFSPTHPLRVMQNFIMKLDAEIKQQYLYGILGPYKPINEYTPRYPLPIFKAPNGSMLMFAWGLHNEHCHKHNREQGHKHYHLSVTAEKVWHYNSFGSFLTLVSISLPQDTLFSCACDFCATKFYNLFTTTESWPFIELQFCSKKTVKPLLALRYSSIPVNAVHANPPASTDLHYLRMPSC